MPGDLGDARLNAYFLENIYQCLAGSSPSLWHLPMFWPFPYVGGFSDNLFGASPIYLAARSCGCNEEDAFQFWFLASYLVNFLSCYYALKLVNLRTSSATFGALIFTFALPVAAHSGHAQLSYRFGVPLAVAYALRFLSSGDVKYLVPVAGWTVWQFYCSIYIGFFLSVLLASISVVFIALSWWTRSVNWKSFTTRLRISWGRMSHKMRVMNVGIISILGAIQVVLFIPYLSVSQLYGFSRETAEIAMMLPRPESYFLADGSWIWKPGNTIFADLPMRHEHQMFVGLVPIAFGIIGAILVISKRAGRSAASVLGGLLVVVIITLYVGGLSLWMVFCQLPLASAIRAMTRIDLVLLFAVAFLAAVGWQHCMQALGKKANVLGIGVFAAMLIEFSAMSVVATPKAAWRERLIAKDSLLPSELESDSVLFFAQQESSPPYAEELDAMLVSLKRGLATLNGYSGNLPHGYRSEFGDDFSELFRRLHAWLAFSGPSHRESGYEELLKKVVTVGFSNPPVERALTASGEKTRTIADRVYNVEELQALKIHIQATHVVRGQLYVTVDITNTGHLNISSISKTGNAVKLSWRVFDRDNQSSAEWDARSDLPFDLPPGETVSISTPIAETAAVAGKIIEVSLVQEGEFWLHDPGLVPPRISL